MARDGSFHWELEKSENKDQSGDQETTIKCHGELVSNTAGKIKELVSPLFLLAVASLSTLVMLNIWTAPASERWLVSKCPRSSKGIASLNSPT